MCLVVVFDCISWCRELPISHVMTVLTCTSTITMQEVFITHGNVFTTSLMQDDIKLNKVYISCNKYNTKQFFKAD